MNLDKNDSLRLSLIGQDKGKEKFLKKYIKEGDIVLDLGANIGYFTCMFAQRVGKNGKVFAFEPEEYNFGILEKNIKENNFVNTILEKKAVSNKKGIVKMYLSESTVDHRIYDSFEDKEHVNVETIILDEYFKNNEEINFVKSNIQGSDFAAIMGMTKIIDRSKNLKIMTEFDPGMISGFGMEPSEFIDFLIGKKFKIYDMPAYGEEVIPISKNELFKKYSVEKRNGTNLFCVKE